MYSRFETTLRKKGRNDLMRTIDTLKSSDSRKALLVALALLFLGCSQLMLGQQPQPRKFASTTQAVQALYEAVRSSDENAVHTILGCGPELASSGSDTEDRLNRERFTQKYQQMHRLVREPDGTTVLYIGAENWPFPIPLVSKGGKWYFDADTGSKEVLARAIGGNEIVAIQLCQAFQDVSRPHVERTSNADPIREFAAGLANAQNADSVNREPFHGYYFRRVAAANSTNIVLVAYPTDYRSSGVMTFVITADSSVYEKDLGPKTATAAQHLQGAPAADWTPVQQ
jgi:hypothetical protein